MFTCLTTSAYTPFADDVSPLSPSTMQGMCWNTSVFVAVVLFRLTSSFVPSGDIWASIRCRCNDVTFANIHRPYYNLTPRRRSSESASPRDESDEIIRRTEFIQRTTPLSRREMISLTSHTLPMLWAIDAVADESTHSQEEPKVCRNGGIVTGEFLGCWSYVMFRVSSQSMYSNRLLCV